MLTSTKIDDLYNKNINTNFNKEGGHVMIFKDSDGILYLVLHTQNNSSDSTRTLLIPITDNGSKLTINVKLDWIITLFLLIIYIN